MKLLQARVGLAWECGAVEQTAYQSHCTEMCHTTT